MSSVLLTLTVAVAVFIAESALSEYAPPSEGTMPAGSWVKVSCTTSGQERVACSERYKGSRLHELVRSGHQATVASMTACVQDGCDIDGRDEMGNTALHQAVLMGNLQAVSNLLHLGCAPSPTNSSGRTPLFIAHVSGRSTNNPASLLLIACGARLTRSEAVCIAAMQDDVPTLAALVDSDPALVHAYEDGTPLHYAARAGAMNAAAYLISHGADPNAKGVGGSTPLHLARYGRQADMFDWLVRHGASTTNTDDYGSTPDAIVPVEDIKKLLLRK